MIMADKIVDLRKKNGWSQEELAEHLGVTRQSVSKWESAQSVPDLERVLCMSQLFGVSTDYLLKDELGEPEYVKAVSEDTELRQVSMEEANRFLTVKAAAASRIALATFLCIISPAWLLALGAAAECGMLPISEEAAVGLGMIALLIFVAVAVSMYIACGMRTKVFEYLEREEIETAYGVRGMVRERQERYRDTYIRGCIIGAALCILSVLPLFCAIALQASDFMLALSIALLLILAGMGVVCFIYVGIPWASMEKLLEEGEYSREAKRKSRSSRPIADAYWLIATAIYLGYSFLTNNWHISWVVWPVAGVLYPAACALTALLRKET